MLYVSCTINSSWIQGQSVANHYGYHTALRSVPRASRRSQDVVVAFPSASCQTGCKFQRQKSSVLKCLLHFICLLDFPLFLNTSARNSFALLFPAHCCLLLPGVNIFSTLSFFSPNTVTGEEEQAQAGSSLSVLPLLCRMGKLCFFLLPFFATSC